jgi:hypothetical protein
MSDELKRLRETLEKARRVVTVQRLIAEEVPLAPEEEAEGETVQPTRTEEQSRSE